MAGTDRRLPPEDAVDRPGAIRVPRAGQPLEWTGERLTSAIGGQLETEHLHRYAWAREAAHDRDVLDLGCGEGYGSALLAAVARSVVGVDVADDAIEHATRWHARENLRFARADARRLPEDDGSFDVVVAFELIEHVRDQRVVIEEVARVLRPDGTLLISTPNRAVYRAAEAPNPFHERELDVAELEALLSAHFSTVELYAQQTIAGSVLLGTSPQPPPPPVSFTRIAPDMLRRDAGREAMTYILAAASNREGSAGLPPSTLTERGDLDALIGAERERDQAIDVIGDGAQHAEHVRATLEAREAELSQLRERYALMTSSADVELAAEYERRESLARELGAMRHEIMAHRHHSAELAERLSAALHELALMQDRHQIVVTSRSWSLTAPLRTVASSWRSLIHLRRYEPDYVSRQRELSTPSADELAFPGATADGIDVDLPQIHTEVMAEALRDSTTRLRFPAADVVEVSVVIVVWNAAEHLLRALAQLARDAVRADSPTIEVIVVDNASSRDVQRVLQHVEGITVMRLAHNEGYVRAANLGASRARGAAILHLNSDAFVRPGALGAAWRTLLADPARGVVGGRLIQLDGTIQEAGAILFADGTTNGYLRGRPCEDEAAQFRREVDYVSFAFALVRTELWQALGGLDERFAPGYYEDVDLCLRAREQGFTTTYEPGAVIDHVVGGSHLDRQADTAMLASQPRLCARHRDVLRSDQLPPGSENALHARSRGPVPLRRVLVIDNEVPFQWLGSGFPRMRELLRVLVEEGCEVTHYSLHGPGAPEGPRLREHFDPRIEFVAEPRVDNLGAFLHERRGFYDTILVSRPTNMTLFNELREREPSLMRGIEIIYDAEALFADRRRLQAALDDDWEWDGDAAVTAELDLARSADRVTCVSEREAVVFRAHGIADVTVLGHVPARHGEATVTGRSGVLFVGGLMGLKESNNRALRWFVREVWPRVRHELPQQRLTIAGPVAEGFGIELESEGVDVLGELDDLDAVYAKARVFVAPTFFAAGIPLKVLDAAAQGVPVVAPRLVADLLGWSDDALAVADTAADTAARVGDLLRHDDLWIAQSRAASARIDAEFSADRFRAAATKAIGAASHDDDGSARVRELWSAPPPTGREGWSAYPLAHPVVARRLDLRLSGDPEVGLPSRTLALLKSLGVRVPLARSVSLCCGHGALERALYDAGLLSECMGFDQAPGAVQAARAAAVDRPGLRYELRDLDRTPLSERGLDAVFSHNGLHHLEHLEQILDSVAEALRSDGVFVLYEFVGPSRFQWTDRQIDEINAWLAELPRRLVLTADGQERREVYRPTIEEVVAADPSEAIRSGEIVELLSERFTLVERADLGMTLAMMALAGVAHNFDPDDAEATRHLERLLDREDELMASGELASDMAYLVARPRR